MEMKKIASNELKEFLQDWLNWAEGRESRFEYEPHYGLCSASIVYDKHLVIMCKLDEMFNDDAYPFGGDEYRRRKRFATQHQDPNRLAWVKAALNDTLDTWELME